MSFQYNKNKGHDGQDSMWTSYSDLFLGLSVVFLLLYVTASLRQGTDGIRQHLEYQKLTKENQDIKQQLKMYSTLKQDYIEKEAANDEKQAYEELMSKLDLLQEEAKTEKIKLQVAANENDKKEKALNKYQQMIRNIMNANMIAKSRIKNRDSFIDDQEETITEQTTEIKSLNKSVAEKKTQIAQGQAKIEKLEENLGSKLKQLKNAYKHNQITKQKYEQQQKQLKTQAETQIAQLKNHNSKAQQELNKLSSELNSTKGNLAQAEQKNVSLQGELQNATERHKIEVAKLRGDFDTKALQDRAAFDAAIKREKLTGAALAAREAQFRAEADRKQKALGDQIANLGAKYQATSSALAATEQKNANLQGELQSTNERHKNEVAKLRGDFDAKAAQDRAAFDAAMKREKLTGAALAAREAQFRAEADRKQKALGDQVASLGAKYQSQSAELAKAQENLNARKNLANLIKSNFAKNGIKADVDVKTGDVILAFGDQYFDSDSSNLKNGMRKILEQAVPVYSNSLFENQKIADKISNVEIVGFASPTFKGKYIDPKSLNPEDRAAVNYNLDLSYNRARAIFNHVFDQNKMQFKYQQKLLPLVKVTGRSFFDQAERGIATEAPDSFCKKNDCAKLQRVIIKFNLKD